MATSGDQGSPKKVQPIIPLAPCQSALERLSPCDFGNTVTIDVGSHDEKRLFIIYEGLLKHYSSYFRAALKQEWIGQKDCRIIKLPECSPKIFDFFYHWLFTGTLYTKPMASGDIPLDFATLCAIYVFGDIRGVQELCNSVMSLLFQKCRQQGFPSSILSYVYKNTPTTSLLRKFVVDLYSRYYRFMGSFTEDTFPSSFLIDVLQALSREDVKLGHMLKPAASRLRDLERAQVCSNYHNHSYGNKESGDKKAEPAAKGHEGSG